MALQTFMSLHSCKVGVGVGSLYGIPTFRLRHSCNSESNLTAINAAEAFMGSSWSSVQSSMARILLRSDPSVRTDASFIGRLLLLVGESAWSRSLLLSPRQSVAEDSYGLLSPHRLQSPHGFFFLSSRDPSCGLRCCSVQSSMLSRSSSLIKADPFLSPSACNRCSRSLHRRW